MNFRFVSSRSMAMLAAAAPFGLVSVADAAHAGKAFFQRVSTFNVCEQIDPTCNTDIETSAETLWYYTTDSTTDDDDSSLLKIVYTDSPGENLGFVDITDPSQPKADGILALGGEPTTVRVVGNDYGTYVDVCWCGCVGCVYVCVNINEYVVALMYN